MGLFASATRATWRYFSFLAMRANCVGVVDANVGQGLRRDRLWEAVTACFFWPLFK